MSSSLYTDFIDRHGPSETPLRAFFAPGRVNLIGDHTDYNGGLVFPCGIERGTRLLIRPRQDRRVQLASSTFDLAATIEPDKRAEKVGETWVNFPLGVLEQFRLAGYDLPGFDCLYTGDVPNAAGLSSSASLEVVTAYALNSIFEIGLSRLELVQMAQRAENDFVGMQCGIMDQYAVCMARADHAMALDCDTLECEQVPLQLGDYRIVLLNSNQRRELTSSLYNERVAETRAVHALMSQVHPLPTLASYTIEDLQSLEQILTTEPVLYQRARHVITEHQRVKQAVSALKSADLERFGSLMVQSHQSLYKDYAVSSDALNTLVELALSCQGVLGARLTGAGFGGCTVNLVHQDHIRQFVDIVLPAYSARTALKGEAYVTAAGAGVRETAVSELPAMAGPM